MLLLEAGGSNGVQLDERSRVALVEDDPDSAGVRRLEGGARGKIANGDARRQVLPVCTPSCGAPKRREDPRRTPLHGLLESLYERVKGAWEGHFERSYGFWRGLVDEVVGHVGHAQRVFTIPKMLRIYFLHQRELLGALSLAAYETVRGPTKVGARAPGRMCTRPLPSRSVAFFPTAGA